MVAALLDAAARALLQPSALANETLTSSNVWDVASSSPLREIVPRNLQWLVPNASVFPAAPVPGTLQHLTAPVNGLGSGATLDAQANTAAEDWAMFASLYEVQP